MRLLFIFAPLAAAVNANPPTLVNSTRGVASTSQQLASEIGVAIMAAGGSACAAYSYATATLRLR